MSDSSEDPVVRFREGVDRALTGNINRIRNLGDPLRRCEREPKEPKKEE